MTARSEIATCLLTVSALSCGFDASGLTDGDGDGEQSDAGRAPVVDATTAVDGSSPLSDGATLDAFACPPGYQVEGESGSAYRAGADLAWLAAESACEADGPGAHLVVIDDESENATVDAISTASRSWIGYSELGEGEGWAWVTAEAGWTGGWDAGNNEPDGTGDCAAIDDAGEWRDQSCADTRDYLCECDGRSADPDSF